MEVSVMYIILMAVVAAYFVLDIYLYKKIKQNRKEIEIILNTVKFLDKKIENSLDEIAYLRGMEKISNTDLEHLKDKLMEHDNWMSHFHGDLHDGITRSKNNAMGVAALSETMSTLSDRVSEISKKSIKKTKESPLKSRTSSKANSPARKRSTRQV